MERYDEAIQELSRALELAPESLEVRVAFGLTYEMAQRFDAAAAHYEAAIQLDPFNPRLYHYAARALMSAENYGAARANYDRAGVLKLATLVLGDAHAEVAKFKDVVDLAFIDADKEGYLDYLRKLSPLVRPGGLIVAHNMASPPPDPRYVDAVTASSAYDTIFLNMHDAGVGVTLKKR